MRPINVTSEQQHLQAMRIFREDAKYDVYKACVAVACNGMTLPEESSLSKGERVLLEVRRQLFKSDLKMAENMLKEITFENHLLEGDKFFLQAQVYHRRGEQPEASRLWNVAADKYCLIEDFHRELRARVNGALVISTLESCLYGDLLSFEQEAKRQNFLDIAANIARTRAIELLKAGMLNEAYNQSMEASALYQLDGYQDDRAVAVLLAAISQLCLGNLEKAAATRGEVMVSEGKTKVYINIYNDLLAGKIPKVQAGHTMSRIAWKKIMVKTGSISGKIIENLRKKSMNREELIAAVWGENATDQSYCGRLYVAINAIRKDGLITIIFDGENYKII